MDFEQPETIDVEKVVKKKSIRTKFQSYPPGEWMSNIRIDNVLLALTDMVMTYPTSYDLVIRDMKTLVQMDMRDKWTCVTVNTDDSSGPGYHYNHVLYGIPTTGTLHATFLEPLPDKSLSKHMEEELLKEIPGAATQHFAVGAQRDGSSCGYISAWWQIHVQGLVNAGHAPVDWRSPPEPPDGWNRVCRRLFTIFDMQVQVPTAWAEDIGLRTIFRAAMESGHFPEQQLMAQIDEYGLRLQVQLHSVSLFISFIQPMDYHIMHPT